jgi:hypothetical protein
MKNFYSKPLSEAFGTEIERNFDHMVYAVLIINIICKGLNDRGFLSPCLKFLLLPL